MKKVLTLIAGVAFVAVLFTSCKKNYTCTCTITGGTSVSSDYGKTSKKAATDACDASSAALGASGSCSLSN